MSQSPQPDRDASIHFLLWFEPQGPWCLTGIHPDPIGDKDDETRKTPTRTFVPGEESQIDAWLAAHAGWNVYFSVNAVRGRPAKKCNKNDIAEMRWVHVDLDPADGADIAAEQARIETLLMQDAPGGLPRPSLVTFSGGGYQAFWRLKPAVIVTGKEQAEAELEPHIVHVIQALGGDKSCRNLDRIMRLPGSVNWPNERKRKKGRAPALARVVVSRPLSYPLSVFPQAAPEARVHINGAPVGKVAAPPAAVKLYESSEALPGFVPDALRRLILLGHDERDPERLPSRSEWCWFAICELVRVGMKDAEIEAVIRDPKFAISAHVLENKDVERYVARQIARARERAIDPVLQELNDKHAVIADVGGKCRILGEVYDHSFDRTRISLQTFGDFCNRYANRKVKVGEKRNEPVYMPAGQWWTHHERRRQFDTMTFAPGKDVDRYAYNLWRGFALEPKAGDCSLYLQHLASVACRGEAAHYEYLVKWMANAVQNPGEQGHVAVVLKGRQGAGKGVVVRHFGSLFGRHFLQVSDGKHLVGNFNAHLRDCVVLFGDEAFYAGDKKHESVLKTLVTERNLVIEPKGVDVEVCPNYVHLMMASNEEWAVPAGGMDRRFFVLHVDESHALDVEYFKAIEQQMANGGRAALLHHLLSIDLSDFEVRLRPETKALQAEKGHSLSARHAWWQHKLQDGRVFPHRAEWPEFVVCQELADDFVATSRKWAPGSRASQVVLGLFLKTVVPGHLERRRMAGPYKYRSPHNDQLVELDRPHGYLFPDLEECREHWKENFDRAATWEKVETYCPTPFGRREQEIPYAP